MYQRIQLAVLVLIAAAFGLAVLVRKSPNAGWLQTFRDAFPRLTDEQRAKVRREGDFYAGMEFILLGIALPPLYMVSTMMLFSGVTTRGLVLVVAASMLCIALGVTAIWKNRSG